MDEIRSEWSGYIKHGDLADIGKALVWLAENSESCSFTLTTPQAVVRVEDTLSLRVSFWNGFEAAAFRSRFQACDGWRLAS